MSFLDDLRRFGPGYLGPCPRAEAIAYCAGLTASHYENFSVVTRLTPRPLRPHFASIYSFCRWADDLGDEVGDRERSRDLLLWWRRETEAMYANEVRHPVFVALAETVREFSIPIDPFLALISAFEQDQEVTEYDTYARLLDYCTRSANPVGHLVLYLGRCHDELNARLSDFICTGLQLANFWQDVARDLTDIGRIYLPLEDRERFGVTRESLVQRRFTPEFRDLLELEVGRARSFFLAGKPLQLRMPRELAIDIDLFTRGGIAILDLIAAKGYDVLTARPKLSKSVKVRLLGRALWDLYSPLIKSPRKLLRG